MSLSRLKRKAISERIHDEKWKAFRDDMLNPKRRMLFNAYSRLGRAERKARKGT